MNPTCCCLLYNSVFSSSFVLGGGMSPASNSPHSPFPTQIAVPPPPPTDAVVTAGPLPTTDRQTSRSLVITRPAGEGIIVFVNIMC